MSLKTLPILYINMGGEMIYILDQRLQVQSVKQNKSSKVLGDIVGTMFSKKFVDEIFKAQELLNRKTLRVIFEKLSHASIMRLNTTSMDKLYDLMTMAVKFQLQSCSSPREMLAMTLNHLDGVRKLVQGVANLQSLIDHAYNLLSQTYFEMNLWELSLVRSSLLCYFQDARVKVSLLLREKKQKDDGRFVIPIKGAKVPFGGRIPGTIQYYQKGKPSRSDTFKSQGSYSETMTEGSLGKTAKYGERGSDLGLNIYRSSSIDTQGGFGSSAGAELLAKDSNVQLELQLLSKLIGPGGKPGSATPDFTLSLFDSEQDEKHFVQAAKAAVKQDSGNVIKIDASRRNRGTVEDLLMDDMSINKKPPKKSRGDELLDLMDAA